MITDLYYILRYYGNNSRLRVVLESGGVNIDAFYFKSTKRSWKYLFLKKEETAYGLDICTLYMAKGYSIKKEYEYYIPIVHGDRLLHNLYRFYNYRTDKINNLSAADRKKLVVP